MSYSISSTAALLDTIIIGAGPIGLETAAALQAEGQKVCILDAGPIGSTIVKEFPSRTRFFTSPDRLAIAGIALVTLGQEQPTRDVYLAYLRNVVCTHKLDVRTFHAVQNVEQRKDSFEIEAKTRAGEHKSFRATNVVFATGGMGKVRNLEISGENLPHVSHRLGEPHQYYGRRVLIVGGANSACEAALRCWTVGAEVSISYRGSAFSERVKPWIRPTLEALIAEGRVTAYFSTNITQITPSKVTLQNVANNTKEEVAVDDILLLIGYEHDSELLRKSGVNILPGKGAPEFDEDTMMTNVPGIYVAGTATAGTQKHFHVFIETCHIHAQRITAAIVGASVPKTPLPRQLEEN